MSRSPSRPGKFLLPVGAVLLLLLPATLLSPAGVATTDPAHPARLLGGEVFVLQMDADDHNVPSASRTQDVSGRGNHGGLSGVTPTTGRFGNGYQFNGAYNYISVPDTATSNHPDGSLTMWVRLSGATGALLFSKVNPGIHAYLVVGVSAAGEVSFATNQGSSTLVSKPADVLPNVWTHVAVTWGPQGKRIYINGAESARNTDSVGVLSGSRLSYFGNDPNNTCCGGMTAVLDDARFYDRAITPSEAALLASDPYRAPGGAPTAPRGLTATPGTDAGTIDLAWQAPDALQPGVAVSYQIHRLVGSGSKLVATTSALAYREHQLPTGTHAYQVYAVQGATRSLPSDPASATIVSAYPGEVQDLVGARGPTFGEARLSWMPPDTDATGYHVYREGPDGIDAMLALSRGTTSTSVRYLVAGTHRFWVSAVNGDFEGKLTETSVTVEAPVIVGLGDSVSAGHGLGPARGFPDNPGAHANYLASYVGGTGYPFGITGACAGTAGRDHASTPANCRASILRDELPRVRALIPPSTSPKPSLFAINVGANDISFADCMGSYLGGEGLGACEDPTFQDHINALASNLLAVIGELHRDYPDVPISVNQYYNPFPLAQATPCGIYTGIAIRRDLSTFNNTDGSWEASLASAQAQAAIDIDRVLRRLNLLLGSVEGPGVTAVPVDFTGHDMCRANRQQDAGLPIQLEESWVYPPELHVRRQILTDDAWRHFVPAETCAYLDDDPPPTVVSRFLTVGGYYAEIHINCTPHPTHAGQRAIARAILAELAPGREPLPGTA